MGRYETLPFSCSQFLLTLPFQLQSILNSPWINTNEAIPESEQLGLRGLLRDVERELKSIDTEITSTQEYILLLQERRTGYVEDMKKLRLAMAPHRSLPPEILAEIFLHYAAEIAEQFIHDFPMLTYRRLSPFPWVLGHICSRWRQIALAEPRIWSTIGFKAAEQGDLLMLNEAFKRGGQSRLWLLASDLALGNESIHHDFLRDVVCSQSKRITELELSICGETFEKFLFLPSDSFPMLEAVRLAVFGSGFSRRTPDSDMSVFRGAVRLRRIEIIAPLLSVKQIRFPMNLCLSWPQLTHVNFGVLSIQVSIAHEFMMLCTSLHECDLILMADVFSKVPFPAASICLPHLRKLIIQEDGPDPNVLVKFIRPLVLPALEDFDLSPLERSSLADIAPLADLAPIIESWSTSRYPTLRSNLVYLGGHLTEIAGHLPFLTSIYAYGSLLPASGIRMMTQEQYLPKLALLEVEVAWSDMEAFIDMLKTRWMRSVVRQQQHPGASVYLIRSGTICVSGANEESISLLSNKILEVQEELGISGVKIDLRSD